MANGDESKAYRKRLTSLTTHLRKYEQPTPHGYDVYATSYIAGDIPWRKILSEEAESADLPPFTPKFEIEHYTLQEEERKLRGESVRNQDLIPSSEVIFDHIKEAKEYSGTEEYLSYLYFKAMQYSELNKARALNEKYPKPDENKVRSTYSREHQAAVAATLRETRGLCTNGSSTGAPLLQSERQLVQIPIVTSASEESRRMARTETEIEELSEIRRMIKEAVGMPPLMRIAEKGKRSSEEPWQFKAKSETPRPQPAKKKKLPWKKNIYPPKSREEKIAELRKLAPPIPPEILQTDQLPGLWKPELMIDSFKTLYMEAQEAKAETGKMEEVENEDHWWKLFYTNKKCREWLSSIPDTL